MSDSLHNQPETNQTPNPDSADPGAPKQQPSDLTPRTPGDSFSPETPLPDFTATSAEEPDAPLKSSVALPANLNNFLTNQRSGETPESTAQTARPVYKISPAEPDLPGHVIPSPDEAEADAEEPSGWQTAWAITREVGETIILTLIIFFIIQLFIRNFRVVGTSMVNNLHDGQYLIINKISYNPFLIENLGIAGPKRGDVIVFKPPRNPGDDYVKRVIGLPGEKVQVIKGQVYINDELLEEPFQPTTGSYTMPAPVVVPEGQVFVLGDNRNNSNDSHNWGPLPIENIVGRAWLSYWPPDQWGTIPRDAPTEEATFWRFLNQVTPHANAQNE